MNVLRFKQYLYVHIIIYTVVVWTKRATTLCLAWRLATTLAGNKHLIFQTTSQPELLAAVFDPIIKSFSSYTLIPHNLPTDDTVECVRRNGKGVHTLPEGVRREFETSIHVKCTTIRAHCFGITHVFIPPSHLARLPARRCDDSSLIVPAFNLLCTITSDFSLSAHPVSWSIRQYIVPIISQKRASATAAVDFHVNSKNVRRMVRLWLQFNFQWVNEKWVMARERGK